MSAACCIGRRESYERRAIVLATIDCIVWLGHNGLAAARVAEEGGFDIETVRRHFPTTSQLAEGVLEYVTGQILLTLQDDLPPEHRLRMHLMSLATTIEERPGLFLTLAELETRSRRDGLLRGALRRSEQRWRDTLARLLRDGGASGTWARELDDGAVVDLVIATAVGLRFRGGGATRAFAQLEALLLDSASSASRGRAGSTPP
jgi:AcrR family transcriptional regulator